MNLTTEYDLVIIGTGPAAGNVAAVCRDRDWTVAIVDSRPFGGTCALRGCNPKTALTRAAELSDWYRRARHLFKSPADPTLDWERVIDFKRSFTAPVTDASVRKYSEMGLNCIRGRARFVSPTTVSVDGQNFTARRFVIATGAEPVELDLPGTDLLTRSDTFLEVEHLPDRIVFVGGGYISFEFAHAAARAGAHCTIIEQSDRPLRNFDPDLVRQLVAHTRSLGIDVRMRTRLASIRQVANGQFEIGVINSSDVPHVLCAGMAVHGAGREPALRDLDLASGEVEFDRAAGVAVDRFLRSRTNPAVFAAGDAADTGAPKLSPVADYEGRIVARNLTEDQSAPVRYGVIPMVAFTVPPIAAVGLSEEAARSAGAEYQVLSGDDSSWNALRKLAAPCAGYKLLVDRSNDQTLGAHVLGPGAADLINLLALAIQARYPARRVKELLMAFPTMSATLRDML